MRGIKPDYNKWTPQPKPEKKEKPKYTIAKQSSKAKAKNDEKRQMAMELDKFCKEWYNTHETKRCYECNGRILVYTKMNGHHIIARRFQDKYNIDLSLNADNMVLLCMTCHSKVETNIDHAPRVKELTEKTLKEFEQYLI